jgi:hypothetical protein
MRYDNSMKTCTKCAKESPSTTEFFYRDRTKSDNLHSWCIPCVKASRKQWRQLNPETVRANQQRNWKKMGRTYELRKNYGITAEIYDAMSNAQGGVCAICKEPPKGEGKLRLAVDHDHKTLRNRGLLCAMCNHAVERIENDPDWGTKALNYLARYIEQTVKG